MLTSHIWSAKGVQLVLAIPLPKAASRHVLHVRQQDSITRGNDGNTLKLKCASSREIVSSSVAKHIFYAFSKGRREGSCLIRLGLRMKPWLQIGRPQRYNFSLLQVEAAHIFRRSTCSKPVDVAA